MSQIQLFSSSRGVLNPSDDRRLARAVSRGHVVSTIRSSDVQNETDVALAKIDATTATSAQAMAAVVHIGQLHKTLELLLPEMAGRLAYLGEDHTLGLGETAADLRRQLRRI